MDAVARPVGVKLHTPLALAVVVPSVVEPSLSVTTAFASPVPVSVSFAVILSLAEEPVSLARLSVTTGAVVSRVKVSEEVPVLPAASVSLATMVWAPLARPVGVKLHTPLALAVVVPSVVEPSLSVTTAFASPDPVSVSFAVILSLAEKPVSLARLSVTAGAVVSRVKVSEEVPVLPAASVSLATMVWAPLARPVGVKDHTPLALAVVVPSVVEAFLERHHRVGIARPGQRRRSR